MVVFAGQRRAGVRIESIIRWASTYHLWHPPTPSCPAEWSAGGNVQYLMRDVRLTRCMNGRKKRTAGDLSWRVIGQSSDSRARRLLSALRSRIVDDGSAEIELLLFPGAGQFSSRADCKIAVVLDPTNDAVRRAARADIVLAERKIAKIPTGRQFALDQLPLVVDRIVAAGPPRNSAVAQRAA